MIYPRVTSIKLEDFYHDVVEPLPFVSLYIDDNIVWDDCSSYNITSLTDQVETYIANHSYRYVTKCNITVVDWHHYIVEIYTCEDPNA